MSESTPCHLPLETVAHVAANCLCLKAQRAARALARRFDAAFRPFGLTNGQFSLMMALNGRTSPGVGQLAEFLAMDRTSLTAALKPLARRGLVRVTADPRDGRARLVSITPEGVTLLEAALPVWRDTHHRLDHGLSPATADRLRGDLPKLTAEAQVKARAARQIAAGEESASSSAI